MTVTIPSDLTLLSDDELKSLKSRCIAEFYRIDCDELSIERLDQQTRVAEGIERIRAALTGRRAERRYLDEHPDIDVRNTTMVQLRYSLWERVHGRDR
jgi:hypothetical protein